MQRFSRFVLIFAFCFCNVGHAQETLQHLGEWMSHYYEKPEPDQFTKWINEASAAGAFEKPSARFPIMIFTSEILKTNPGKGNQWCKDLSSISSTNKAFIGWSFYNSNTPASEECVRSNLGLAENDIKKIMASPRHDPLANSPSKPADLDMLWAVFMATGSKAAVDKIIDVLARPLPENGQPGSVQALLLKGAAKWSLSSNIHQHKRVAEIARTRRSVESGMLRDALDEVITNASKSGD